MSLINDIADLLRQHVGRDNAIKSRQIAECLGLPETADRTIRYSIAD